MSARWHALTTLPGSVRLVQARLQAKPGHGEAFLTYLPLERGHSYRRGISRSWTRPLLGSYLLVWLDLNDKPTRNAVVNQAGVRGFLKADGCVLEVSGDEIAALHALEDDGAIPSARAKALFASGDVVKVNGRTDHGIPLAGLIVRESRIDRNDIRHYEVDVSIFGQVSRTEVEEGRLSR